MALREFLSEELIKLFQERLISCENTNYEYFSELKSYLNVSMERFLFTVKLMKKHYKKKQGRILEIGSFPFFLSTAIMELSDDELTGVILPKSIWPGAPYKIIENSAIIKTQQKNYSFSYWILNVEKDRFPFNNKTFDLVLCTEVIEHLIQSPSHMITEINRILKDDGLLILSTPNGLYWEIIHHLIFYGSLHDRYSRYGVYGRHNRLWILSELEDFIANNNFDIIESICNYSYTYREGKRKVRFNTTKNFTFVNMIQDIFLLLFILMTKLPVSFCKKKNGDQLYVIAKKIGPPRSYESDYLYSGKFSYNLE